MPQVGTEEKFLFGYILLLPNLVDHTNNSYPINIELSKFANQPLKDINNYSPKLKAAWKIIYPTQFSSAPTRGIHNAWPLLVEKMSLVDAIEYILKLKTFFKKIQC